MAPTRFLLALLLLSVLFLAAPAGGVAQAAQKPSTEVRAAASKAKAANPLNAAAGVGRRYWGTTPCHGQIEYLPRRAVPANLSPDADAWVTFDTPLGANNLSAPASSYTKCAISFAKWRWPTTASMHEDWDMLCMTMTHEMGHLLGHVHDETAGSVMAPVFTDYSGEPSGCKTARTARTAR